MCQFWENALTGHAYFITCQIQYRPLSYNVFNPIGVGSQKSNVSNLAGQGLTSRSRASIGASAALKGCTGAVQGRAVWCKDRSTRLSTTHPPSWCLHHKCMTPSFKLMTPPIRSAYYIKRQVGELLSGWLSPLCHDHASNTFVLYTDNSRETLRYEVFVAEILNYTCGAKDILTFGVHAILWMPALRRH